MTRALAQIFALYFVVAGFSLLLNRRFFKAVMRDLTQSHIAMMLIGFMTLILGIILITIHNTWNTPWEIIVSVMCWMTFSAGVIRTLFPAYIMKVASKVVSHDQTFYFAGILCVIMSGIYGYVGFLIG